MRAGRSDDEVALLPTLTHARIRAEQGDPGGARLILEEILRARPDDADARRLLDAVGSRPQRARPPEPADEPASPPVPGDASTLRARLDAFGSGKRSAVVRLSEYLARIESSRRRERPR